MNFGLWLRFALRDLRSGLQGFWVFLSSLALGTAAIAIIGSLSAAVERGLDEQGQPLLGGDVEFSLIHRQTTPAELTFISSKGDISIAANLRGMAKAGERTTLVEIKSADQAYPLYGALELEGGGTLAAALDNKGVAVDPLLLGRLGVKAGDTLSIGTGDLHHSRRHRQGTRPVVRRHRAWPPRVDARGGLAGNRPHPARQPHHLALPRETG